MRIFTIGGYGFTEESFLATLQRAGVDAFVDVRQRRGMRGPKYSFLNSSRLQALLATVGIRYVHARELAPTTSVRDEQREEDRDSGTAKRDRTRLSPSFVERYRSEILSRFDAASLLQELEGARDVVLFCVEGSAAACHRSLAAEHLVRVLGRTDEVEDLAP